MTDLVKSIDFSAEMKIKSRILHLSSYTKPHSQTRASDDFGEM